MKRARNRGTAGRVWRPIAFASILLFSSAGAQQSQSISLRDAISFALKHSPVVESADAEAAAARAMARSAGAMLMPQLTANGFASTGNDPAILGSSPAVGPQAFMATPAKSFVDGNLMLMAPIVAPRLRAMAKSANRMALASKGDLAETRAEIALEVTGAYDRVLLADQMVIAAQAEVNSAKEMVRTTQVQFDAGSTVEATVQRAEAELANANREVASSQNERAKALLDLQAAMGADMSHSISLTDTLPLQSSAGPVDGYLAKGRASRGILSAAAARVKAAEADSEAAADLRAPQLNAVAMGDATNMQGGGGLMGGLTLSVPLIDGGQIAAERRKAEAIKSKAQADLRQAEIAVEKDIRQAWLDLETARANVTSADAAVKAAGSAYEIIALRVNSGKSILVEQLDSLQALYKARSDLAQALYDQAVAAARLDRASGVNP